MSKVKPSEGWAENGSTRIHYMDSKPVTSRKLIPLVYIPGALNAADGLLPEMEALAPRRCVSMALRGRGKSDAPRTGYTFQDNISDVETVVDKLGLNNFCLMGWSLGVPHVLRYATRHPEKISGLILLDYPARYPRFTPEWTSFVLSDPERQTLAPPHAVKGIQEDSQEIPLWDELKNINLPVLVIGGGIAGSKTSPNGSLLKAEHIDLYRKNLRDIQIIVFEDSGHNVSQPDFRRFTDVLNGFLEKLDTKIQE